MVDKPGAPHTSLAVASIGPARNTPDYAPIEVLNTVFGGMFSSRINMNLREEHGYTYGVSSSFAFRRGEGPFSAGGSIRIDATAPATEELFREIKKIRDTPVTAAELDMAKSNWGRSLPGMFESTTGIVGTEGQLFTFGLPVDYYRTLPEEIGAVTVEDVGRMAKKYLDPNRMIVVAVGDRERIEPGLEKLGLGPTHVVP